MADETSEAVRKREAGRQRGKPQHAPTAANLEKAMLLYGMGYPDADVAASDRVARAD